MNDKEFEAFLKEQDLVGSDFFESAFKFWFNDDEHIRSPFPEKYQAELRELTFRVFMEWVFELSEEEKSKLENDEIAETFEMILFSNPIRVTL